MNSSYYYEYWGGAHDVMVKAMDCRIVVSEFVFQSEEPSLPYYLPIAGGRIIGFIPFPRVLVLCEMQSVLSRN